MKKRGSNLDYRRMKSTSSMPHSLQLHHIVEEAHDTPLLLVFQRHILAKLIFCRTDILHTSAQCSAEKQIVFKACVHTVLKPLDSVMDM